MAILESVALASALAPTVLGGGQVKVPSSIAKPTDPTKNILDDGGFVKDRFSLAGQQNQDADTARGLLGNLTSFANQQGPSSIANSLITANNAETGALRDSLQNQNASQMATASANLATKGGRGSGARERLASNMATNNVNNLNQINQQSSLNNLNTLAQDEDRKFGLLQQLPGQFMNMANRTDANRQFDIGNSLNTSMNTYNQGMQAYGANQLARQQAQSFNAGNKGLLSKVTGGLF